MSARNRIKRHDNNHFEVTNAIKSAGYSVVDLSQVGGGVDDILVGAHGKNYLFEIKNSASSHGVSDSQSEFYAAWGGQSHVVNDALEALIYISQDIRKACKK